MDKKFLLMPIELNHQMAVAEVVSCNQLTIRYGLTLSPTEAKELVDTRSESLKEHGRLEFAGGIINKLITVFCDSPYLQQSNYTATLHDLIETFYYYKNETLDQVGDDELISLMKKYYDQTCCGSLELLRNRELALYARQIRYGESVPTNFDQESSDDFEEGGFEDE